MSKILFLVLFLIAPLFATSVIDFVSKDYQGSIIVNDNEVPEPIQLRIGNEENAFDIAIAELDSLNFNYNSKYVFALYNTKNQLKDIPVFKLIVKGRKGTLYLKDKVLKVKAYWKL